MGKRVEDSGSGRPNVLLLTDEKDNSIHWFRQGLQKALDGYASTRLVDRNELAQMIESNQEIGTVIVDTVYTSDWQSYITSLKSNGVRFIMAAAAPDWRDARTAIMAGASDYITQSLVTSKLRKNILGD